MSDQVQAPTESASGFAALGLDQRLVASLTAAGYAEPTPIQREAIPPLLAGKDLIGLAATGTGKTAAFALPLVHRLAAAADRKKPSVLILVPTRELCVQVSGAVERYGKPLGVSVVAIYGGAGFGDQVRGLRQGADVVVATPGRTLDHLRRGTLALTTIAAVVLDEADEMLDMGFADDLEAILSATPKGRQTMLFSATMPPRIEAIAGRHQTNPVRVEVARAVVAAGEAPQVRQTAHVIPRGFKPQAVARVLEFETPTSAIIFCRTRSEADELTDVLAARGYRPESLHGGLSQEHRDRVMRKFREGTTPLLIATDVAARGLDIGHLSHVINYHVPPAPEVYVHRTGRVGRAGRAGVAITLVEQREVGLLRNVERVTRQRINVLPVPTAADLKVRRAERTRAALREAIVGGGLDEYRALLEPLAGEFEPTELALAALKLAAQAAGKTDDGEDVPVPTPPRPVAGDRGPRPGFDRNVRSRPAFGRRFGRSMTKVFLGVGREAGVTPRDIVAAIEHEVGLNGRDLGGIELAERFALVEVPSEAVDEVIQRLDGIRLRGRKVPVRLDRAPSRA